jgi:hypothetical protein
VPSARHDVDIGQGRTYRGDVTGPGEQRGPDEGWRPPNPPEHPPEQQGYRPGAYGPTPYDDRTAPPYVYNPYANVAYPPTYPGPPAGLGADDPVPARRPGSMHAALVLLLLATVPYLLGGLVALLSADSAASAVPPEQLAEMQRLGVDLEQVVRTVGVLTLAIAVVFALLAILAWTGRRWARALLTATTIGFALMVFVFVAAAGSQGVAVDAASLVFLAGPTVLAAIGVALMFRPPAREWFSRGRR